MGGGRAEKVLAMINGGGGGGGHRQFKHRSLTVMYSFS